MAYQQMASVYDRLMDDAPYDKWLAFTLEMFRRSGKKIRQVTDLGCGTGRITTKLAEAGYDVTGVDYSDEMLSYAQQRASSNGQAVQWIHQDLRELAGLENMDAVVSYCDVINYITTEEELATVFQHVAHMLNAEGIFVFDVHALNHVQNDLVGETFAVVDEDMSYVWFCSPSDMPGEMYHDLTFFVADGDEYVRFDESHHQRTFPVEHYQQLLHAAGFDIRHVLGDFSIEAGSVQENTERIFIVAEKRSEK